MYGVGGLDDVAFVGDVHGKPVLARAHSSDDTSRKAEGKCRGEIRIKRQIRGTLKYVALKKKFAMD